MTQDMEGLIVVSAEIVRLATKIWCGILCVIFTDPWKMYQVRECSGEFSATVSLRVFVSVKEISTASHCGTVWEFRKTGAELKWKCPHGGIRRGHGKADDQYKETTSSRREGCGVRGRIHSSLPERHQRSVGTLCCHRV